MLAQLKPDNVLMEKVGWLKDGICKILLRAMRFIAAYDTFQLCTWIDAFEISSHSDSSTETLYI